MNVRKHSGAHHVLVRLAQRAGNLQLTVEDDGKGFSFSGRLSDAELETTGKGPGVIRERVRLLAGRTHDRIDSGARRTAGSTDPAGEKGKSWIGQQWKGQRWTNQPRINEPIPYAL